MASTTRYADVALAVKTAERSAIFTYALTPETYLSTRPGIMVEVLFRGRPTVGIITQLRARLPQGVTETKIRPIRRILSPIPILDAAEFQYRQFAAKSLHAPLSRLITHQLPSKTFLKTLHTDLPEREISTGRRSVFLPGSVATLSAPLLEALRSTLQRGWTGLVIVPTEEILEIWLKRLEEHHLPVAIYRSQGSAAEQSRVWTIILKGLPQIILGTRSAVFLPFRRLGFIFIEEAGHTQHQEEQFPSYHSLQILSLRQQSLGGTLFIRDPLPPLSILERSVRKYWSFPRVPSTGPRVTISEEITPKSLNPHLQKIALRTLAAQQRVLIIVPEQGLAAGLVCRSCEEVVRCPACQTVLRILASDGTQSCFRCQTTYPAGPCRVCQSNDLVAFALGATYWQKTLDQLFPPEVRRLWQIVTPAFGGVPPLTAAVSIVIEPERLLGKNNWQSLFWYMRTLWDIRSKTQSHLLIQSTVPDQPALTALPRTIPLKFLVEELERRHERHYPPYGSFIEIHSRQPRITIDQLIARTLQTEPVVELASPIQRIDKEYTLTLKIPRPNSDDLLERLRNEYTKIGTVHLIES